MFIGVDPDLHSTAWAVLNGNQLQALHLTKIHKDHKDIKAVEVMMSAVHWDWNEDGGIQNTIQSIAVEAQEIYLGGTNPTKNPRSLLHLAYVSGSVAATVACPNTYLVRPQEWKGSVPKSIHQARTFKKLGWGYASTTHADKGNRYCFPIDPPKEFGKFNKGDWKHLADAIGLAFYARDRYVKEKKKDA